MLTIWNSFKTDISIRKDLFNKRFAFASFLSNVLTLFFGWYLLLRRYMRIVRASDECSSKLIKNTTTNESSMKHLKSLGDSAISRIEMLNACRVNYIGITVLQYDVLEKLMNTRRIGSLIYIVETVHRNYEIEIDRNFRRYCLYHVESGMDNTTCGA